MEGSYRWQRETERDGILVGSIVEGSLAQACFQSRTATYQTIACSRFRCVYALSFFVDLPGCLIVAFNLPVMDQATFEGVFRRRLDAIAVMIRE